MPQLFRGLAPLINGAFIPKDQKDAPLIGMGAAMIAYFLFAMMNVFAKLLSEHMHVIEVAFYRNIISVIPFAIYIGFWGGKKMLVIRQNPIGIITRSIVGLVCLVVTFGAYSVMPMADTTAFLFLSSLFMPILCVIFLKEHVGPYRWSAILIGFIGAVIMATPTGAINYLGVGLALASAFLQGGLGTLLRHLGKTEHPITVTFYFVLIGAIGSAIPMFWMASPVSSDLFGYIIGVGLAGAGAQFMLSTAFKYAPASLVTLFNYTGIIWATLFGWFFWNDWPTWPIWLGGAIVIFSNIFIVIREQRIAARARNVEII